MRVAHVITRLILGGAQENTVLCCEDLLHHYGNDVLLVTGPPLGPEGSLLQRALASGVPIRLIDSLRRTVNPWRDVQAYVQLKAVLRDFRPDVVHTHSAKGGMIGRAASWSLGIPAVVHTVHGAPFHPYQSWPARAAIRACERWAARRCHAMISVADRMTELMVAGNVAPREKFTTIYSGMEVEPYLDSNRHRQRVRDELGYTPEQIVIAKVARLFHLKGHEYLVRAAEQVVRAVPNARFLLVGDGILKDRIRRQIDSAGLGAYFQFTGLVPPECIPELLAASDLVVHASLREGLARVLPQALISGKPVVSFDVDGAREVVLPNETGFLVPPRNATALAAAMIRLAAAPDLRCRLGQEGRRRFSDVFRHEHMTAQIRHIYLRLLDRPAKPPAK